MENQKQFATGRVPMAEVNRFDPQAIVKDILTHLQTGTLASHVPEGYRKFVDRLAIVHYENDEPDTNESDFKQDMLRNWLIKYYAFPKIVRRFGLINEVQEITPKDNNSVIACLTSNASSIVVGPGAFAEPGGKFWYQRINLRDNDVMEPTEGHAKFLENPTRGKPAIIRDQDGDLQTSPLITLFTGRTVGDVTVCMSGLQGTLKLLSAQVKSMPFGTMK